jgi:hypothetical protein
VVQLVEHHRWATRRGTQHELVHVEGEPGPTVPAEQALPGQPSSHPLVDLLGGYVSRTTDQRAGVLSGLQQARHHHRLEIVDRHGLVLVADQGDELLG